MANAYVDGLFSVEGKVIVITGGGGILCGTMARELAKTGAKLAVLDIMMDAAQKVVEVFLAGKRVDQVDESVDRRLHQLDH